MWRLRSVVLLLIFFLFCRALHRDLHCMPLLLWVAVLFRLHQAAPHFFIYRSRAIDLRPAVKPGDATLRQNAFLAQLRFPEVDGEPGPVGEVLVGRAPATLPQRDMRVVVDHRAAARADLPDKDRVKLAYEQLYQSPQMHRSPGRRCRRIRTKPSSPAIISVMSACRRLKPALFSSAF